MYFTRFVDSNQCTIYDFIFLQFLFQPFYRNPMYQIGDIYIDNFVPINGISGCFWVSFCCICNLLVPFFYFINVCVNAWVPYVLKSIDILIDWLLWHEVAVFFSWFEVFVYVWYIQLDKFHFQNFKATCCFINGWSLVRVHYKLIKLFKSYFCIIFLTNHYGCYDLGINNFLV